MKTQTFLLLGTNLGDRKKNLAEACRWIKDSVGKIEKTSAVYQTEPWGKKDQPEFLNQAVMVDTDSPAHSLLEKVLEIEKKMGRRREERWGERTMDIDIVFYGDEVINTENLVVPHPRMAERRFVLVPLAEIGGEFIHPLLKVNVREMLGRCEDELKVTKVEGPDGDV